MRKNIRRLQLSRRCIFSSFLATRNDTFRSKLEKFRDKILSSVSAQFQTSILSTIHIHIFSPIVYVQLVRFVISKPSKSNATSSRERTCLETRGVMNEKGIQKRDDFVTLWREMKNIYTYNFFVPCD